jgi:ATP-dependent Clp protease adaptor protein ClpS
MKMIARPILMQDDKSGDGDNANRGTSVITRTKPKTQEAEPLPRTASE